MYPAYLIVVLCIVGLAVIAIVAPGGVFIAPILAIALLIWAAVRYQRARSGTL